MSLPAVADDFRWTAESWGAALRCRPLETVAPHLFTTRQLQLSPVESAAAGWSSLARALGVDAHDVRRLRQVHGSRVVTAVHEKQPAGVEEADGLISGDAAVALAIVAADCAPILMADRRTGAVAAVHAGWRGTAAGVTRAALQAMAREFGTRPPDVIAAIGPTIGACCYEVGTELVDAFAAAGHERYLIDRWFTSRPPRKETPQRSPLHLDVAGANRDQLVLAGVPDAQIHVAGICTAMHLDLFTSYRAEKERATRVAGAIRRRGAGEDR
jgi:YfiH family protein